MGRIGLVADTSCTRMGVFLVKTGCSQLLQREPEEGVYEQGDPYNYGTSGRKRNREKEPKRRRLPHLLERCACSFTRIHVHSSEAQRTTRRRSPGEAISSCKSHRSRPFTRREAHTTMERAAAKAIRSTTDLARLTCYSTTRHLSSGKHHVG